MLDISTYQTLSINDRVAAFYDYLISQGKSKSTAKDYSGNWMDFYEISDIVKKMTGKVSLYEIDDVKVISHVYAEIRLSKMNKLVHGYPSATVKNYRLFIEALSNGGICLSSSSVAHTISGPVRSVIPVNPDYVKADQFITSGVPTDLERKLMELIVNHRMLLRTASVCFADIINQLEVVFSPELKERTESVSIDSLRAQLIGLKKEKDIVRASIERVRSACDKLAEELYARGTSPYSDEQFQNLSAQLEPLYNRENRLIIIIERIEEAIASGKDSIEVSVSVMGEFVSLPTPKVVLYYNNMGRGSIKDRYSTLCGVFVHEMFHAWNYFMAGYNNRSVLTVDEPMVEFAGLVFLRELNNAIKGTSHTLSSEVETIWHDRVWAVCRKQAKMGTSAAYGFGHYLYENIGKDEMCWIEEYAWKSAAIPAGKDVQDIELLLIPCFPCGNEKRVVKLFEMVIFSKASSKVASKGAHGKSKKSSLPTLKELLMACIATLAVSDFTLDEACRFEPVFKAVYPADDQIPEKIKSAIDELVTDGYLVRISADAFRKS